jgi:hypothetical protein
MKQFLDFAGDHPIVTILLASMVLGTVVKLIPWSKKDREDRD